MKTICKTSNEVNNPKLLAEIQALRERNGELFLSPNVEDHPSADVVSIVAQLVMMNRELASIKQRAGYTPTVRLILQTLAASGQAQNITEIASAIDGSVHTVRQLCQRLTREGVLAREMRSTVAYFSITSPQKETN
jgi:hypothetical protein